MDMVQSNQLEIRHISPEVRKLIKMYADVNNCTQSEMLERMILEWDSQQSQSERPPGDEDE
ncbi:hypothetical protein NIES4072_28440 [Nostoc commune NIES-4072]|uniref:Uncharacterized protein n=1 Tax=Nostoc commune NIES-4072 TaxID=2005467 RepID=A0A2R5FK80_NOSCO|nr:hypothetical protein [Nostoc commune]BBD69821.1 hypothetical protein NIES4070_62310 [Nostoc commune HK-02]GBG19177.1 hypothetical protein NIES4072_28440 [Nostoc commune NIES-4072]